MQSNPKRIHSLVRASGDGIRLLMTIKLFCKTLNASIIRLLSLLVITTNYVSSSEVKLDEIKNDHLTKSDKSEEYKSVGFMNFSDAFPKDGSKKTLNPHKLVITDKEDEIEEYMLNFYSYFSADKNFLKDNAKITEGRYHLIDIILGLYQKLFQLNYIQKNYYNIIDDDINWFSNFKNDNSYQYSNQKNQILRYKEYIIMHIDCWYSEIYISRNKSQIQLSSKLCNIMKKLDFHSFITACCNAFEKEIEHIMWILSKSVYINEDSMLKENCALSYFQLNIFSAKEYLKQIRQYSEKEKNGKQELDMKMAQKLNKTINEILTPEEPILLLKF